MNEETGPEITRLLEGWRNGDRESFDLLVALLYPELRRIASHYLRAERGGQTLQSTALVHEAYVRLVERSNTGFKNRAHFIGVAAQIMRTLLVDRARARATAKRGDGALFLSLNESIDMPVVSSLDVLKVDDALNALSRLDPQKSRVVELRFFGGLTNEEVAEVIGVSPSTIKRDWSFAKAWMFRELSVEGASTA